MPQRWRHTPEQDATFIRLFAAGEKREEIIAAVNAMPGGQIESIIQFDWYGRHTGARRPAGWDRVSQTVKAAPLRGLSRSPAGIPLREVYRLAAELHCPRDVDAVSRAEKQRDPSHPGYRLLGSGHAGRAVV